VTSSAVGKLNPHSTGFLYRSLGYNLERQTLLEGQADTEREGRTQYT